MRWSVIAGLLFTGLILSYVWCVFVRQLQEGRILSSQNYGVKRSECPIRFWFAVSLQLVLIGPMSVCWVLTLLALMGVGNFVGIIN